MVALPHTQQAAALIGFGVPPQIAGLYQEMPEGITSGHIAWEPGQRHVAGHTPVDEVLRGLLAG